MQEHSQGQVIGGYAQNATDMHLRQQALNLASYRGAINAVPSPNDTRPAKDIVADAELYLAFLKGGDAAAAPKSN